MVSEELAGDHWARKDSLSGCCSLFSSKGSPAGFLDDRSRQTLRRWDFDGLCLIFILLVISAALPASFSILDVIIRLGG